jgi:dCMP deaminase
MKVMEQENLEHKSKSKLRTSQYQALSMFGLEEHLPKKRLSWDEYFMEITDIVAKRSTCLRRTVGAVIVKDKHILTTGYNGAPRGLDNCVELNSCLRQEMKINSGEKHEICRGAHAEQNAIVQAAYHGIKIEGSTLYCTYMPCVICSKMAINAGIKRIVFKNFYPDDLAVQLLNESEIELVLFNPNSKK